MADSPYSNDVVSHSIPWRKATNLHRKMGARIIPFSQFTATANTAKTLFAGPYAEKTTDRVIGIMVHAIGATVGSGWILNELTTGYLFNGGAANYAFNIITPNDFANITITSTIDWTAAMNVYVALFNVEIPPGFWQ